MTTDPAATLQAAAVRLRELAGALPGQRDDWYSAHTLATEYWMEPADARLVEAMSPPVALAVADLLASEAGIEEDYGGASQEVLAVARLVLGEAS